jgi:hypothetical protein
MRSARMWQLRPCETARSGTAANEEGDFYEKKQLSAAATAFVDGGGAQGGGIRRGTLNQLFNVAVAEKLAILRTVRRFQEQIRRAGMRNPSSESGEISIGRLPALIATVTDGLQGRPAPQPDCAPDEKHAEEKSKPFGRATPQVGKRKKWLERTREDASVAGPERLERSYFWDFVLGGSMPKSQT